MTGLIQFKNTAAVFFIELLLICIGFTQLAQAVVPPPDGGYPNFTTAEGDHALQALTTGVGNTAVGTFSLFSVSTGNFNTAVGAGSLDLNTADSNTAVGAAALLFNTTGIQNTAAGTAALEFNDTGSQNTATGAFALFTNTTGENNTAEGAGALQNNTIGLRNTATGAQALFNNIDGGDNTATGSNSLFSNTTGAGNTAVGSSALLINTTGNGNTATGSDAMLANTEGTANTANGSGALFNNTTGTANTALGFQALSNNTAGSDNTAIGDQALAGSTGSGSIAVGSGAGAFVGSSNNVIAIGSPGDDVDASCFIGNIRDRQTSNNDAVAVVIDSTGMLGTVSSSRRFKQEIKPMDKASESILALEPVTFRYKNAKKSIPQFGLIAEEVARVNPDLVVRDKNGEIYSVRYDQVNAMLLNEFLKEHRKVQELEATVAKQQEDFQAFATHQQKQIEMLTAGLQKVSAQLEVSRPAPQTVLNKQ